MGGGNARLSLGGMGAFASFPEGYNDQPIPAKGTQVMRKILRALHNFSRAVWAEGNQKLQGPELEGMRELRCPKLVEITHLQSVPIWQMRVTRTSVRGP